MKKVSFEIRKTNSDATQTVEGYMIDGLAIFQRDKPGGWTIIHLSSGDRIGPEGHSKTRKVALESVEQLLGLKADWDCAALVDPNNGVVPDMASGAVLKNQVHDILAGKHKIKILLGQLRNQKMQMEMSNNRIHSGGRSAEEYQALKKRIAKLERDLND